MYAYQKNGPKWQSLLNKKLLVVVKKLFSFSTGKTEALPMHYLGVTLFRFNNARTKKR